MYLIYMPDISAVSDCHMPRLTSRLPSLLNKNQVKEIRKSWLMRTSGWVFVLLGLLWCQHGQAQQRTSLTGSPANSTVLLANNESTPIPRGLYLLPVTGVIADCPSITNTNLTAVEICSGQPVPFLEVNTSATDPPYSIEFVRFDSLQANPYLGKNGVHMVKNAPQDGKVVVGVVNFPVNTTSVDKVYYVYGCLKPEPDVSVCSPFALITVTVKPQPPKCVPVVIRRTKIHSDGSR